MRFCGIPLEAISQATILYMISLKSALLKLLPYFAGASELNGELALANAIVVESVFMWENK